MAGGKSSVGSGSGGGTRGGTSKGSVVASRDTTQHHHTPQHHTTAPQYNQHPHHHQHPQHFQPQPHQNGPSRGTRMQCGPAQYRLGLYGWRRRCLYALVLLLLVMVIFNLALTLFILKVLDFSTDGMGGLQIVKGRLIAHGDVHIMDTLVASRILSRQHTPIRILAADNFSISATSDGQVTNTIFMNSETLECTSERFVIRDKVGRLLFSATRDEVLVGARRLTVRGEGGAVFNGSVQTPRVEAPVGRNLTLESLTRSLEIKAPQGVSIESRAGSIKVNCLQDFLLQSTAGVIMFDTPNIFVKGLRTSTEQRTDAKVSAPTVYQLCVCSSGRLFLAGPTGVCAANQDTCK